LRKWMPEPRRFTAWSDRVEKLLCRGLVILTLLLLIFQTALQMPVIRAWLSPTERLEGIPYHRHSG
jgi:hypothetical protein